VILAESIIGIGGLGHWEYGGEGACGEQDDQKDQTAS
jgi:hypothetical protein